MKLFKDTIGRRHTTAVRKGLYTRACTLLYWIALLYAGSAGAQVVPSPVAYWLMDEPAGTEIADDSSGNNHLLLSSGAQLAESSGFVDGALSLMGGAYASRADADLDPAMPGKAGATTEDFTISAWIHPNAGALGDRNPILTKQGAPERGFMLSAGTSGGTPALYFEVFESNDATTGKTSTTSSQDLGETVWQHVAVIYDYDPANDTALITLCVEGVCDPPVAAVGPLRANSKPLELGRYTWGSYARYFDGLVDEVQVFDVALTTTQISDIIAEAELQAGNEPPDAVAAAAPTSGLLPLTVGFDASGSSDDVGISGYLWEFGDGSAPSTEVATSHTYNTGGDYTARLTVTDTLGKTAQDTVEISATDPDNAPPVADFTVTVDGLDATLDAGPSDDPDGTIVSYDWDLGDGTTATGSSVSHTYVQAGTFDVTLTVVDDGGQPDQITKPVSIGTAVMKAFELNRDIIESDRGFPWDQPPAEAANGDWLAPVNYAEGTMHVRAEIRSQPVPEEMSLQFCIWQCADPAGNPQCKAKDLKRETCAPQASVTAPEQGGDPMVITWSTPISSMWVKDNTNYPMLWDEERRRYGFAIKDQYGEPVTNYNPWGSTTDGGISYWAPNDSLGNTRPQEEWPRPDYWYPIDARLSVVVVPPGETFGGWTTEVLDAPPGRVSMGGVSGTAPQANDDSASVATGSVVDIAVLDNDVDAENDTDPTTVSYTQPGSGTVSDDGNGLLTYTHDGSATTSDSFTYTVSDANGNVSDIATVTVTITGSGGQGPLIDVWYGSQQSFGDLGEPPWAINILGNVSDADGLGPLTYSLNGGAAEPLSIGPFRRLADPGDFNVEIAFADLSPGANTVEILAEDGLGNLSSTTVDVQYPGRNIWPLPYAIDWSATTAIPDVAQIVDGQWAIVGDTVEPVELRYDRLVAAGDRLWTDYEVTVPVTINSFDPQGFDSPNFRPAVGVMLKWPGHDADDTQSAQPRWEYRPQGGGAWYELEEDGTGNLYLTDFEFLGVSDPLARTFALGTTYIWKVRVETEPNGDVVYSAKVWQEGETEPVDWELVGTDFNDVPGGSLLLVAHFTDVSFGDVQIEPVGSSPPSDPKMHHGSLSGVGASWQTVNLPESYTEAVVVASVQYDTTPAQPVVTRIRNVTSNSFEVRVQNPSDESLATSYAVHYVVAEAGVYTLAEHGIQMEARQVTSTVTNSSSSWSAGETLSYSQGYTSPVVLGQVMSFNDPDWSAFWARGASPSDPPSASDLVVSKHVGEDSDTTRADEALGVLIIEAGTGQVGGSDYAAALSDQVVSGTEGAPPYLVAHSLGSTPSRALISSAGMKGGNGGWPVAYGSAPFTTSDLGLATEEDQIADLETSHLAENVAHLVFGGSSGGSGTAPQANDDSASVPTGAAVDIAVLANDVDAENDIDPTSVSYTQPVNGTVSDDGNGMLTYTHDGSATTSDSFTYTVSDANGNVSNTATVTLTIEEPVGDGPKLAHGSLSGVGASWQTVNLPESYTEAVVVASVQYDTTPAQPVVTRIRNVTSNSFEVRVQNPSDESLATSYAVHYVVAEAGVYTLAEHGIQMEARQVTSTVTNSSSSWSAGETLSYSQGYTSPVVLGQVMSFNDPDWSAFWARGASPSDPPSASDLVVSKHVGEDSDTTRADEALGVLIIEAGTGQVGGSDYAAALSDQVVSGTEGAPPYLVAHSLGSTPSRALISSAGMKGGNGGWPVAYGSAPFTTSDLGLATEEDQIADLETSHLAENVAHLVFGN